MDVSEWGRPLSGCGCRGIYIHLSLFNAVQHWLADISRLNRAFSWTVSLRPRPLRGVRRCAFRAPYLSAGAACWRLKAPVDAAGSHRHP